MELFIKEHKIENGTLIGHSMGAKAVMAVALRKRVKIGNLIPVDNAPVDAALKSDFGKYVVGMRKIEEAGVKSLRDADKILADYEEALPIRQFLLTNLIRADDGTQKFKVPLKYLTDSLSHLGDFPYKDPDEMRWEGPTLFVRGTQSHYIADDMLPVCGRFFPKFELADIDAGHWVISEKPEEFKQGESARPALRSGDILIAFQLSSTGSRSESRPESSPTKLHQFADRSLWTQSRFCRALSWLGTSQNADYRRRN